MVVTRMGVRIRSARIPSVSVASAALDAAYAVTLPRMPRSALIDEIVTRCPAFCLRKISTAASHCASAATKFVSAVCRLARKYPVPTGWPLPMPAFTMMRSRLPRSPSKARNTSKTWSKFITSSERTDTWMPGCAASRSRLSASRRSTRRAQSARLRPILAYSRAMPSPSPELAPVMRMFFRIARILLARRAPSPGGTGRGRARARSERAGIRSEGTGRSSARTGNRSERARDGRASTGIRSEPISIRCESTRIRCQPARIEFLCPHSECQCPQSECQCPRIRFPWARIEFLCPHSECQCPQSECQCPRIRFPWARIEFLCPHSECQCPPSERKSAQSECPCP